MTGHQPQDPGVDAELSESPPPPQAGFSRYSRRRGFFRFFTWWLVFAGIYASSSVCPCCGRVGCPVGGVGAGLMGGFFALVVTKGKTWLQWLAEHMTLLRSKLPFQPRA